MPIFDTSGFSIGGGAGFSFGSSSGFFIEPPSLQVAWIENPEVRSAAIRERALTTLRQNQEYNRILFGQQSPEVADKKGDQVIQEEIDKLAERANEEDRQRANAAKSRFQIQAQAEMSRTAKLAEPVNLYGYKEEDLALIEKAEQNRALASIHAIDADRQSRNTISNANQQNRQSVVNAASALVEPIRMTPTNAQEAYELNKYNKYLQDIDQLNSTLMNVKTTQDDARSTIASIQLATRELEMLKDGNRNESFSINQDIEYIKYRFQDIYDKLVAEGNREQDIQQLEAWRDQEYRLIEYRKKLLDGKQQEEELIQDAIDSYEQELRYQLNGKEPGANYEEMQNILFQNEENEARRREEQQRSLTIGTASRRSTALTDYNGQGNTATTVNFSYQGWFGIQFCPRRAFMLSYIGIRSDTSNGNLSIQRPMPLCIIRWGQIPGGGFYPAALMSNTVMYPGGITYASGNYKYMRIAPMYAVPGDIYGAYVFYYSQGTDTRQDDRYHYFASYGNRNITDLSMPDCTFSLSESSSAGRNTTATQFPNIGELLAEMNPDTSLLSSDTNDNNGIEAANVAIATSGAFAAINFEPWINAQRPRQPVN